MNRTTRRAFDQAAGALNTAFEQAGPFPDQEATPPLLAEEVGKCLDLCQQLDAAGETLPPEETDELGTHALECLSDLGLWAYQLKQDEVRATIENTALDMAEWIAQYGGRIGVLEPVVNAIARQANATQDPAALATLFDRACSIISCTAPELDDAGDTAKLQPWLALHFNTAIIAVRTQRPGLINAACDLLENRLPRHCTAFYEEALRESAKPVYGDQVRAIMRERLAKWTPRG
ncbi:MAG: hypothetical protein K2X06_11285 [Burkholderiales bacterium]|nr:hypothetical protein [Burkholderiales bacterium]